jgi:hypothetical protein
MQQLHFSEKWSLLHIFYEDEGKLCVERFLKIQYWNTLQSLMGNCNLIKTGQQQQTLYLNISVHFCVHHEHNSEYLM